MRYGLTILTYVPANALPGVRLRLRTAITSLWDSGYTGPVFVVDDGSTDTEHLIYLAELSRIIRVVRRPNNGGISRAKNTCLRILFNLELDIGFLAEDDIAFSPGWFNAYVEAHKATGFHHFSWAWDKDPRHDMYKELREINGYPIVATSLVNGVFLSFTRKVLLEIGGFKVLPAPWGHEHTNWTKRIIKAGLLPYFADVQNSNDYIDLNCHAAYSTVNAEDRPRFAMQNEDLANDLTTAFYPFEE